VLFSSLAGRRIARRLGRLRTALRQQFAGGVLNKVPEESLPWAKQEASPFCRRRA